MTNTAPMAPHASKHDQEGDLPLSCSHTPANPKNAPAINSEASSGIALPLVVSECPRNSRETTLIRLDTYMGRTVIDVRNWYVGSDGERRPGKGITMDVRHLPALASGLAEALKAARNAGLVEGGAQ